MAVLSRTPRLNGSCFITQSNPVPNLTIHIESTPNKYLLSECHSEKTPNTSVQWFLANYFLYHFIKSLRSQAGVWLTYMGDMDVASFLVFMSLLILSRELPKVSKLGIQNRRLTLCCLPCLTASTFSHISAPVLQYHGNDFVWLCTRSGIDYKSKDGFQVLDEAFAV